MWAVLAQPRMGLTPMIPTPNVDFGIARADVIWCVLCPGFLETEDLVDQHHGDPSRGDLPVDDDYLVDRAVDAVRSLSAGVFEPQRIFIYSSQTLLEVRHDLLRPDDENDPSGATDIRPELAAAHRSRKQRPGLGDRVDAPEHDVRRRAQAADLVGLGLAVHAPDPRSERVVAPGLVDLVGNAHHVERLRGPMGHLGVIRDEAKDNPLGCRGVRRPEDGDSIRLEGGDRPLYARLIRCRPELPAE